MSPLSHAQAHELIQRSVDGLLQSNEQRLLEQHLAGCAECRAYANQLSALETGLRASMLAHWPQGSLTSPAKSDLVKKLQKDFGNGAPPPAGPLAGGLKWLLLLLVPFLAFGVWTLLPQAGVVPFTDPSTATPSATLTPTVSPSPTASQTLTPSPALQILVAIPVQNVNCREGNSSVFEIADTLFENESYSPNARGRDNLWVRFLGPVTQIQCWVFVENLDLLLNDQPVLISDLSEAILPFADYPPTPTPSPTPTFTPESATPVPQCSDGIDNDNDGSVDYGRDKDCSSPNDNDESK